MTGGSDFSRLSAEESIAGLVTVILRQRLIDRGLPVEGRGYLEDERARKACEPVARAVLASDWLADRERDARADAVKRMVAGVEAAIDDPYGEPIKVGNGTREHMHSEPVCAFPDCIWHFPPAEMAVERLSALLAECADPGEEASDE